MGEADTDALFGNKLLEYKKTILAYSGGYLLKNSEGTLLAQKNGDNKSVDVTDAETAALATTVRLILQGVFDRLPNLNVMLGHLGEAIPFLLGRMDNRFSYIPNGNIKSDHGFSYYFGRNIAVTTSGNMSTEAFLCAKNVLGIENIFFGTDYPFENLDSMMAFVEGLPLSEEERKRIYYGNAEERFGIS